MSDVPGVTRWFFLPTRIDTCLRQLSAETGRTASDLLCGVITDGLDGTLAARESARPTKVTAPFQQSDPDASGDDLVMRSMVIPGDLDARLRAAARAAGQDIGAFARGLATLGIRQALAA